MAFWGAEVRSGKPRSLNCPSDDKGRFHLTQAALGLSASEDETKGSYVQCNVGDNPGVVICSLFPGRTEMCSLNLEFDEDKEVLFSVLGPNSVHLCGFFEERNPDEYGEDITQENSEDEEEEEEEEDLSDDDDGFIVADDDSEEDNMILSPGLAPNSVVKIEEIVDEVETENEETQKAKKKKEKKKKNKKNDEGEQKTMAIENNGIEKEEESGEGKKVDGDDGEDTVLVNGKRKKKKENVEGEVEPAMKKQATEEAVVEGAEAKTSKKKKKKSKNKAKSKGDDATEE